MVIWFNVKEAREHLLTYGLVYTLRPKRRREGKEPIFWNEYRKKAEGFVIFIGKIHDNIELEKYVDNSGFGSVFDWLEKAGDSRYLYKVELVDT